MFALLKYFIIYLNILLCTCAPFPNNTEVSITINFENKVEKELAPIKDFLKKLMDPATKNDEKFELKGEVQGAVRKIIERALSAEKKNEVLHKKEGILETQNDDMQKMAINLFVIPYFCQKFELYGEHWDPDTKYVDKNFNPDDLTGTSLLNRGLDEQTRTSYRSQAKKWNRILGNGTHPLAMKFKTSLQKKYPGVLLSVLAKDIGLAIALLNNAKHGVIAQDPKLQELLEIDLAIEGLSKWASFKDPVMLSVIYEFEKVTRNR